MFPIALVAVAAVAGAGLAGLTRYAQSAEAPGKNRIIESQHSAPKSSKPTDEDTSPSVEKSEPVMVAVRKGDSFLLEEGTPATSHETRFIDSLNQSFKKVGYTDVRALKFDVEDQIATLDLNAAVLDGMGSEGEADFIKVLQVVLGQFEGIKGFKLRVDGKVLDTLGHLDLDDPISITKSY